MHRTNRPQSMPFKNFSVIIPTFKISHLFNARLHSYPIAICKKLSKSFPFIVIASSRHLEALNCDGSVMIVVKRKNLFPLILTIENDHADKIGMVNSLKRECFISPDGSFWMKDFSRMRSKLKKFIVKLKKVS